MRAVAVIQFFGKIARDVLKCPKITGYDKRHNATQSYVASLRIGHYAVYDKRWLSVRDSYILQIAQSPGNIAFNSARKLSVPIDYNRYCQGMDRRGRLLRGSIPGNNGENNGRKGSRKSHDGKLGEFLLVCSIPFSKSLEIRVTGMHVRGMPVARDNIEWECVRRLQAKCTHTYEEMGEIFGIPAATIRVRAHREGWNANRERKEDKTQHALTKKPVSVPAARESFRARIAERVEKILEIADSLPDPQSTRDLDNHLNVLEKAEKVGSRSYGLEEKTGVSVLINLAALSTPESEIHVAAEIEE